MSQETNMAGVGPHALREDGATAVEYAIMVALIAAVIILVVIVVGQQVRGSFCEVSDNYAQAPGVSSASEECA